MPRRTARIVAPLVPLALLLGALPAQAAAPILSATDDVRVASNWLGLGFNQDPLFRGAGDNSDRPWTTTAFDEMTKRVDFIKPARVRLMVGRDWFDPTGTGKDYTWGSQKMLSLEKVLNYYTSRNVKVQIGMWGIGAANGNPAAYTSDVVARVQRDLIVRLTAGRPNIVSYSGVNEPNLQGDYTVADWATATSKLKALLTPAQQALLIGPDSAEAPLAGTEGDIGTATTVKGAERTVIWHKSRLTSFAGVLYALGSGTGTPARNWTFETSVDKTSWMVATPQSDVATPTIADKPWFRLDQTFGNLPIGTQYVRLRVPATAELPRRIADMTFTATLKDGTQEVTGDPINNLTKGEFSDGWIQDWWGQSVREQAGLITASDLHFYAFEVLLGNGTFDPKLASYPEDVLGRAVRQARAAAPQLPVVLSETGMKAPEITITKPDGTKVTKDDYSFALEPAQGVRIADLAVQEARAGVDAALAWCLDGFNSDNKCGMWDHYETREPRTLRPWFGSWSVLSRYLPAGSALYAPKQPDGVRVLMAKLPAAKGWTFVLVNRSAATSVRLRTPDSDPGVMNRYAYDGATGPTSVDADTFPIPSGTVTGDFVKTGVEVALPANSVTVFTSKTA